MAIIEGLKAKRDFLQNQLNKLKFQEEYTHSLKNRVRESAQFSVEFETLFVSKSLNVYILPIRKKRNLNLCL